MAGRVGIERFRYADVRAAAPVFEFELVFSEPVYAFGADFNSARSGCSLILRDEVGDGPADLMRDWSGLGNGFFGFTLPQPVSRIRFTPGTGFGHVVEVFGMDDVALGVVPEPAGALLPAAGAGALRRRR